MILNFVLVCDVHCSRGLRTGPVPVSPGFYGMAGELWSNHRTHKVVELKLTQFNGA